MLMTFDDHTFSDAPPLPAFNAADYFRSLRAVGADPRCTATQFSMEWPGVYDARQDALVADANRLDPDYAARRDYIRKCWDARPDDADEVLLGN